MIAGRSESFTYKAISTGSLKKKKKKKNEQENKQLNSVNYMIISTCFMQKSTGKRLETSSLDLWQHVQSVLVSQTKFYDMHVLNAS